MVIVKLVGSNEEASDKDVENMTHQRICLYTHKRMQHAAVCHIQYAML